MSVQNSHQISDIKVLLKIGANGNGIVSVEKTGTVGNVDTYTITFSDGTTTNFDLTNGTSIDTIEKTDTQGLVDTYTITLTDGSTTTFEVVNGGVEFGTLETETGNPLSFSTDSAQVANNTTVNYAVTQSGTGDPSPSNVRPFIGQDSLQTRSSDRSLVLYKLESVSIGNSSQHGAIVSNESNNVYVVKVTEGEKYTIVNGDSSNIVAYYYDEPRLGSYSYNEDRSSGESVLTAPITGYLAVRLGKSNDATRFGVIAGEETQTVTNLADINIALDSTLYGGTWDIEKGLLTITHARVDMGSLEWTFQTNGAQAGKMRCSIGDRKQIAKVDCEIYKSAEPPLADIPNLSIMGNDSTGHIWVYDTDYTSSSDVSAFTTAITGKYIVYELATPIVLHLTPHAVELLEGANIVTSNGTSIDLVYKTGVGATLADLKPLADCINAVEEAQSDKSDIADLYLTGTTNTSGATILAGTYFYLDGLFCKALLDIASSATFTKGTNYKVTTIGAELTALANS